MSQAHKTHKTSAKPKIDAREESLRESPMMAHLLDALEAGTDIGHYGRLTFVMVARHFLEEDRIIELLSHQPDHNEEDTRAFVRQVVAHDYNPPKRERILQWQSRQDFPICPTPDEPGTCNVYQELRFPDRIYDHINDFWEEQTESPAAGDGIVFLHDGSQGNRTRATMKALPTALHPPSPLRHVMGFS